MATNVTKSMLTEKDYELILGDCYVPFNSENKEEYITAIHKFINKVPNFGFAITKRKSISRSSWFYGLCDRHKLDILGNYRFFLKNPKGDYEFNARTSGKDIAIGVTQDGKKLILVRRGYYSPGQLLTSRLGISCIKAIYSAFVLDILDPSFYSRRMQSLIQMVDNLNAHDGWLKKESSSCDFPLIKLKDLKIYPQQLQLHGSYNYVGKASNGTSLRIHHEEIHRNNIGDIMEVLQQFTQYVTLSNDEVNMRISKFYEELKKKIDAEQTKFMHLFQQKTCK